MPNHMARRNTEEEDQLLSGDWGMLHWDERWTHATFDGRSRHPKSAAAVALPAWYPIHVSLTTCDDAKQRLTQNSASMGKRLHRRSLKSKPNRRLGWCTVCTSGRVKGMRPETHL